MDFEDKDDEGKEMTINERREKKGSLARKG